MSKNNNSKTLTLDPRFKGFTQVQNAVIINPKISMQAKALYAVLLSYAWSNGEVFPGQTRLSNDLGCSVRSIRTYLRELEKHGVVTTRQIGLNKPNNYHLPWVHTRLDRKQAAVPDRKQAADKEYKDKEYKEIRKNGVASNPVLSFSNYCERFAVDSKLIAATNHYLESYESFKGNSHPNLRKNQWDGVLLNIEEFLSGWNIDLNDWLKLVESYFSNRALRTDHNIIHLTSGEILDNRFYEVLF